MCNQWTWVSFNNSCPCVVRVSNRPLLAFWRARNHCSQGPTTLRSISRRSVCLDKSSLSDLKINSFGDFLASGTFAAVVARRQHTWHGEFRPCAGREHIWKNVFVWADLNVHAFIVCSWLLFPAVYYRLMVLKFLPMSSWMKLRKKLWICCI